MSNLANLGIFFGGFGVFFLGVGALWRISLEDKWKKADAK